MNLPTHKQFELFLDEVKSSMNIDLHAKWRRFKNAVKTNAPLHESQFIIESVFRLPEGTMFNKTRREEFTEARAVFYWIMNRYYGNSLMSIGRLCDKDHTSVLNGKHLFENLYATDADYRKKVNEIEFRLGIIIPKP